MTEFTLGAIYKGDGRCLFRVWAPSVKDIALYVNGSDEKHFPMQREDKGYFSIEMDSVEPGTLYTYRLNGENNRPDPASRYQPLDIHGPSQIVSRHFKWSDSDWRNIPWSEYVIYELHVGTFSPEGTFDSIIDYLDYLVELGISAIELMPVSQFPGPRNWGYDGVFPYAVQNTYGGPDGLKRLVDACHRKGLAVILDVVYNHLGPEGNYFWDYGDYFSSRYHTPWGSSINFDGPHSDEVRRFFTENALMWFTDYHIDALRLDAVHAILDFSAEPFLQVLSYEVERLSGELGKNLYLIAESDLNDTRTLRPREVGGLGMDALWMDDFHHAMHTLLTGERKGYYEDFGEIHHLAKAYTEGFIYSGQYSTHRERRHGTSSKGFPAEHFVVCIQNHDQVGNRMLGDRLSRLIPFEGLKLAAGAYLLSPFVPMLFMGEEYGETAPFPYFISHLDMELVHLVREGRKKEFASFAWQGEPLDPYAEETFHRAKLNHTLRSEEQHRALYEFYKELIHIRKSRKELLKLATENVQAHSDEQKRVLLLRRGHPPQDAFLILNFSQSENALELFFPEGNWSKLLDSSEEKWFGPGSNLESNLTSENEVQLMLPPLSIAVYVRA